VRGVRHVGTAPTELQFTLWDDSSVGGRLKGDVVAIALRSGPVLQIPAALIGDYTQPMPLPPPSILEKIRTLVTDLSSDDHKRVDGATTELGTMGPRIAGALRSFRPQQAKTAQERIDAILGKFEKKMDPKIPNNDDATNFNDAPGF
jgi:hypothetical protein